MASLKDMRVRIASTKATQKITKAMQMVAASKLRRAQLAAEAARPYAEKMDAVISNIASASAGQPAAPATGRSRGADCRGAVMSVRAGLKARLLGVEGKFGEMMGISNDWAYNLVKQVGNYGESYERTVGMGSALKLKRGANELWTKGGLLFTPPFQ